jgi:RNA polymerase sigma factor (sigma-70 family)
MQCKSINRTGKPCRNKAVDITGYCGSHHPEASRRPPTGGDFEEKVLKVLRLLGYKVERNVNIKGCQIDIYGEYRTGVITLKIMVECKDYGKGKTVGIEEINKFAGVVAVARNTGVIDKGLFVTTHGFTAAAKVTAQSAGIELTTYTDLSTQLVDFNGYLEKIIAEFKSSPVSRYYIDLSGTEVEDYEGADESIFHRPIDDFINQHLFQGGHSKLALLGNFGTGKSTFCRKYAHDLANSFKNDQSVRIPIIVNLSDYDSKLHIQQLILNTLQFRYNINITYTLCQELQRLGRFILLFDGFDEMATRVDPDTIRENLREINKVSEIAENKFILTCRTHFFRDRVQAEVLTEFDVLYIPEWSEPELKEYLQKRFGAEWESQLKKISGTHNLPELAQTPLFLEMIVETLPKLGEEVKRVELYKVYTDKWIQDQSRRKGARLTADQRSQFVRGLALKLYCEGKLSCHHTEFIPILRQRFEIDDAAQMDYLRSDVQTCTFLTRDASGNYGFRHKSFMEFFVAQTLADEIKRGSHEHLGQMLLPLEIRGFLVDFLIDNPPADTLKEWLQNAENSILQDNSLTLLSRLRISISDTKLDKEPAEESKTKIAAQFLQGDTAGFDLLYHRYRGPLVNFIRSRMHRHFLIEDIAIDIEDIVIDTFIKAWQYRDRLDRVEDIQSFLFRIANNVCIDYAKARGRFRYVNIDEILDDRLPFYEEVIEPRYEEPLMELRMLTQALGQLPERDRHVILGTIVEGKTTEEVGRELNLTSGTVRAIRHRALVKLKHLIKGEGAGSE